MLPGEEHPSEHPALPNAPPVSPAPEHERMRCPTCDYDVCGLPTNRCPECGETFDPERVRRLSSDRESPALPWDPAGGEGGFAAVFRTALFRPANLARDFPGRHNTGNAGQYSLICYALAGLELLLAVLPPWFLDGDASIACWGALVGVYVALLAKMCEVAVALVLAWLAPPTCAPSPYHFWRGLTHATSGFLVITAAMSTVWPLLKWGSRHLDGPLQTVADMLQTLCVGGMLISFLWWCVALIVMVRCRARPGVGPAVAMLAIPLIGAGTVVLGFGAILYLFVTVFHQ